MIYGTLLISPIDSVILRCFFIETLMKHDVYNTHTTEKKLIFPRVSK